MIFRARDVPLQQNKCPPEASTSGPTPSVWVEARPRAGEYISRAAPSTPPCPPTHGCVLAFVLRAKIKKREIEHNYGNARCHDSADRIFADPCHTWAPLGGPLSRPQPGSSPVNRPGKLRSTPAKNLLPNQAAYGPWKTASGSFFRIALSCLD